MLIKLVRRVVPQETRQSLKRLLGFPTTRLHPDWSILRGIGPLSTPHVVLDVGAHHGWFFHCWQDWCPRATIHAFEPYPESFRELSRLFGKDERVTLNQLGVGSAPGTLTLNVLTDSKVSNSFLKPRQEAWRRIDYATGAIETEQVAVTTIDAYAFKHHIGPIYLVKIDVQGFELNVLRGAQDTLRRVDYVFVEAGIQRLYEGASTFGDIATFMTDSGFDLITMRAWHRGNQSLVEADLLFRRGDLSGAGDPEQERYYLELR